MGGGGTDAVVKEEESDTKLRGEIPGTSPLFAGGQEGRDNIDKWDQDKPQFL